ncbi:MAG: hypothetical protein KTR31_00360 [Myxococcales bacterium]|nr:hypothetical protein [Myxococcales bacterium]
MRPITLLALVPLLSCNGSDTDTDTIVPIDTDADADADTDSDADADADTDSDADTDVEQGLCAPLPTPTGATTALTPSDSLSQAIVDATEGDTLVLGAGTYTVTGPMVIDVPLTIRSADDDRTGVIIDANGSGGNLFEVSASDVTIAHVTLTASRNDLIHVQPDGADITGFRLHDVHLLDPGGYGVSVDGDGKDHWVDDSEISCSSFELTDAARIQLKVICRTGALDAQGTRNWTVRDNRVDGFWCENGDPPPAIRFWRGARDTLITRNVVGDVHTGIVVGQTQDQIGRRYGDNPCGNTVLQSIDADVYNNIVYAYDDDLVFKSNVGVDAGIRAESSCNLNIIHNSVYSRVEPGSSIEHSFGTTEGRLANNLVSHGLRRLADSKLSTSDNLEDAPPSTWLFPQGGDFHTAPAADHAIDQGSNAFQSFVDRDIDDEARDDGMPDLGADEL